MATAQLLQGADCRVVASRQDLDIVFGRQRLSRLLLEYYGTYNSLRLHLFHPDRLPHLAVRSDHAVLRALQGRGWIRQVDAAHWVPHRLPVPDRAYLQGGWLEELLFLAHHAAGCDELHLGAQLEWQVGDVLGANEVDVLARRGGILSFTSCKCVQPLGPSTHEQVRQFMLEVAYWNTHFAQDQGRAVLAVTADMHDELRNDELRYPALYARAVVIDVDLLGLEHLGWDRLVSALRRHWEENPAPAEAGR